MVSYDPAADPDLYAPYSAQDKSGKALNKKELQARLGLEESPDVPLIGMVTRMVQHKGLTWSKKRSASSCRNPTHSLSFLGPGNMNMRCFSGLCRSNFRAFMRVFWLYTGTVQKDLRRSGHFPDAEPE